MSSQALRTVVLSLKGRFRAPICATCKTVVGRLREFSTVSQQSLVTT